jgi:predicted acetyltransferase
MAVEYRAVTDDEFTDLLEVDRIGFGMVPRKPEAPESFARGELERTRCAFEGGRMVGGGRNYSFELTVPGGALVPAAAVSWVSVLPTHRRRGVLRGMIDALHADAHEHGEPISMLTASESLIYGRFGYGIATWRLGIEVERAHARFVDDADGPGRVRFLTDDESLKVFPAVYDRARRLRAGMVTRPDFWWPESMHWFAQDFAPTFRVVHEAPDGSADGFALYGVTGEWDQGISAKRLHVIDLIAVEPAARASLWRFLFGVDLVRTISAANLPIDEPLRLMLTDPRRVRTDFVNDGMWLCILDEPAALAARTYAHDARLVLEVHRPDGSIGTFAVEGGPDGATCRAVSESPDVVLGTQQLGGVYLGGVSFAQLHAAGRLDEAKPGAVARADAMFSTPVPPAMTSWF